MNSLIRHALIPLLVTLLWSAPAGAAGNTDSGSPPSRDELLERLKRLEQLVGKQGRLLDDLRQQVADRGSGERPLPALRLASVPVSATRPPVYGANRDLAAGENKARPSGKLNSSPASVLDPRPDLGSATVTLSPQAGGAPVVAGWTGSHPYIRSADGNFRMQFGGRLQFDWRSHTGTATPPSSFFIRRARFKAAGELFKHYEYKVQGDFADTGGALLRDGYININYNPAFQVQIGQFKAPFSQEELRSSNYYEFVERSSVANLIPGRTPGLMFHGELADGRFEYYAGAFNGLGELEANTASTPEGYLRLRLTPFKNSGPVALRNFSFGGAFADGRHSGGDSFLGGTSSRSITFFTAVPVNGEIVRANAEFDWRYRKFALRGEYDQTHQSREGLGADGANLPGVIGKAYMVMATYLLTGEEKPLNAITPRAAFLGPGGGLGAWELAFRYESLQMDDAVNGNRGEAFTFGVNWWLTKFVRYQSNFIFERIQDPLRAPTTGDRDAFSYLSRIQVIF